MANLVATGANAAPNQQVTNYDWAQTVLQDAGLPVTTNNTLNIVRWMVSEEPASNWYNNNNPLNINAGGTGSDSFASLTDSASRTAQYLAMPNYTGIHAALAADAPFSTFMQAVVASPWASGHYNGGASFFSGTPPIVSDQGATLKVGSGGGDSTSLDASTSAASSADPRTCTAKGGGINLDPASSLPLVGGLAPKAVIFTACQVKGIVGGILTGLGGAMIVVGVIILTGRARTVQGAVRGAAGGAAGGATVGPEGAVAGAAAGAVGGAAAAPKKAAEAKVKPPSAPLTDSDGRTEYDIGFSDALSAMMGGAFDEPPPRNRRQADRQAEDLFDSLGISSPGPSSQRNSLGNELPF